jgi:hypothetical protein
MKIQIVLTPDAHKQVAKGEQLYAWDFSTRTPGYDGEFQAMPDNYTFLREVEIDLPSPETAVHIALVQLKKREQEIQAEAHVAVCEVQEERAKLLSLTYTMAEGATMEGFDDAPF